LENEAPFVPLLLERKTGETQLFVKQVMIEDKRYIGFCRKLFLAVDWDMIAGNDSSGTAR
jgi:hypothetical protein